MWFSFTNEMWAKVLNHFLVDGLKASDQSVTFSSPCHDDDEGKCPDRGPGATTM